MKPDQERVKNLLADTVTSLCKNGLNFNAELRVEGLLGITLDNKDVFLVHINERFDGGGAMVASKGAVEAQQRVLNLMAKGRVGQQWIGNQQQQYVRTTAQRAPRGRGSFSQRSAPPTPPSRPSSSGPRTPQTPQLSHASPLPSPGHTESVTSPGGTIRSQPSLKREDEVVLVPDDEESEQHNEAETSPATESSQTKEGDGQDPEHSSEAVDNHEDTNAKEQTYPELSLSDTQDSYAGLWDSGGQEQPPEDEDQQNEEEDSDDGEPPEKKPVLNIKKEHSTEDDIQESNPLAGGSGGMNAFITGLIRNHTQNQQPTLSEGEEVPGPSWGGAMSMAGMGHMADPAAMGGQAWPSAPLASAPDLLSSGVPYLMYPGLPSSIPGGLATSRETTVAAQDGTGEPLHTDPSGDHHHEGIGVAARIGLITGSATEVGEQSSVSTRDAVHTLASLAPGTRLPSMPTLLNLSKRDGSLIAQSPEGLAAPPVVVETVGIPVKEGDFRMDFGKTSSGESVLMDPDVKLDKNILIQGENIYKETIPVGREILLDSSARPLQESQTKGNLELLNTKNSPKKQTNVTQLQQREVVPSQNVSSKDRSMVKMRRSWLSKDKPHACTYPSCDKSYFFVHDLRRHQRQTGHFPAKTDSELTHVATSATITSSVDVLDILSHQASAAGLYGDPRTLLKTFPVMATPGISIDMAYGRLESVAPSVVANPNVTLQNAMTENIEELNEPKSVEISQEETIDPDAGIGEEHS